MSKSPDPSAPYGSSAKRYLKLGWWPIPVAGKAYPEPGTTGKKGTVTEASALALVDSRRRRNVALRHDGTTMSLDVDGSDHDGKRGDKTLAKLEGKLGDLPPSWSSTARGDTSPTRQRFYRVPDGVKLVSDLQHLVTKTDKTTGKKVDGGVEVIHRDHRYSVVAPSVHPDTGAAYQWYDAHGRPSEYPPHVDELPMLPKPWLDALTIGEYVAPAPKGKPGKAVSKAPVDAEGMTRHDRDKLDKWLGTAIEGIIADLDAMSAAATSDPTAYRGEPWDATTFKKAVRLVELAVAPWSSLTLDEAERILHEHAPTDRGFTERNVAEKWASAVRTARDTVLEVPVTLGASDVPEVFTIPLTEVEQRRQRLHPDTFFDPKLGLLSERLGDAVSNDLAIGRDGTLWVYEAGVWSPGEAVKDAGIVRQRVVRMLGNRYRREHAGIARDVVMSRPLPRLTDEVDPRFINVRNGMLEWETGTVHPHDPMALSTVQLPIEYDPAAECPRFDKWLEQVLDPDTIDLLWEVIGYMLMNGNPLQKAVLLVGEGGNGKGTWLRLMTSMMGHNNVSNVTLHDIVEGKFEVAGIYGKLANIAGDIEARAMNNTAKFKALTGGDTIEAQHKYGHPFRFTPTAVPVFSANQLWQSADNTRGYLRRWLVVPFPNIIDKGKLIDERKLQAEAPGILTKALKHLPALMARGDFELGVSAAEVKRRFELESDVVKVWLEDDERVLVSEAGNTEARVGRTEAYKRYTAWAGDSGHATLNSSNFYKRLEAMGYSFAKVRGQRMVLGIRIEQPTPWGSMPSSPADLAVGDPDA
jgi:P4 family phage/plasmid primase-like protien